MKHILTIGLFLFLILKSFAQTDGISYQAVIIAPDVLELPGVDSEGNYLPNATVLVKFTIFDSGNAVEFDEVQTATTDEFGRINLIIGAVEHDEFEAIEWDGTGKDLQVEIDFQNGDGFADMSREILTFVPYAYHRNITATGTLDVDGDTFLNRELTVNGPTNLNSTLDVNNNNTTNLTGDLNVQGATVLDSTLVVNNQNITHLTGALNVGEDIVPVENGPWDEDAPTKLNGTLDVVGLSSTNGLTNKGEFSSDVLKGNVLEITRDPERTIADNQSTILAGNTTIGVADKDNPNLYNDKLTIDGALEVNSQNQIKISSDMSKASIADGFDTADKLQFDINSYPLLVEGASQGIAIKIKNEIPDPKSKLGGFSALNKNNFISFWDETPISAVKPFELLSGLSAGISEIFEITGFDVPKIIEDLGLIPKGNTVSWETIPVDGPMLWGRIEGETEASEFSANADYNLDRLSTIYDLVDASLDLADEIAEGVMEGIDLTGNATDVRPCIGFGACAVSPGPAPIAASIAKAVISAVSILTNVANEIFASYMLITFDYNKQRYRGVSYASGAGDYAEYLLRANVNEKMTYGDIVGLQGGKISKQTNESQKMMVISFKPAVLGALPQPGLEKFYEKVAFMGQVPVKVFGKVNIGDYIVPSGNNDGLGKATAPDKISSKDIKNIVGIAWEASEQKYGVKLINVAVGLNTNDNNTIVEKLEKQVLEQEKELSDLTKLLGETIARLAVLENNPAALNINDNSSKSDKIASKGVSSDGRKYEVENDVIYYEITDADIERGFNLAYKMMQDEGVDTEQHVLWKKIKKEPVFKLKITNSIKKRFDKGIHIHKEMNKN